MSEYANAATITEIPSGDGQVLIVVHGDFTNSDADDFNTKVQKYAKGAVLFQSSGGNLVTGVRIGEIIRLKGFSTGVAAGAECASSCALAWLGGNERFLPPTARLGFHAAYRMEGANARETGIGNALIGAYLTRIGLPLEAVLYITQAAPDDMTWLTPDAAKKAGIAMNVGELLQPGARVVEQTKPTNAPVETSAALPATGPISASPSFDCARATRDDEKAICDDPILARADYLIGGMFKAQVSSNPWLRKFLQIRNIHRSAHVPKWLEDYKTKLIQSGVGKIWQPVLPTVIGQCTATSFLDIAHRFGAPLTSGTDADGFDSGSSAWFRNGGWVVSYSKELVLLTSRVGDKAKMCLNSIPRGCPPGDDRGRTYRITNLRTGVSGILADAQHMCGGA